MTCLGTTWTWQPAIHPTIIALIAVCLAFLSARAAWRQFHDSRLAFISLLLVRSLAIAGMALLLLNPHSPLSQTSQSGRSTVHLMLDSSASMGAADAPGRTSRWSHMLAHIVTQQQLQRLAEEFNLRIWTFDDQARAIEISALTGSNLPPPEGRRSNYDESITQVILETTAQNSGEQIVVIGDGHDRQLRPMKRPGSLAQSRGVVIHTVALGAAFAPPDAAIIVQPRQPELMVDEPDEIPIQLRQTGYPAAAGRLHVTRDGQNILDQAVRFNGPSPLLINLPIQHAKPGLYDYQFRLDPLPGETALANNQQRLQIEVTQRRIAALLLEGEPYWDTKFLAQSLRGDSRVELTHITQVTADKVRGIVTRSSAQEASVPRNAAEFARFDVVILGRAVERLMDPSSAKGLVEYLSEGGNLALARGRPYDADSRAGQSLGEILAIAEPVIWEKGLADKRRLILTPQGRSSPSFAFASQGDGADSILNRLPGLTAQNPIQQLKPAAIVLADTKPPPESSSAPAAQGISIYPAIATMSLGRGQVFAMLGEGLWQWSFLPPNQAADRQLYDRFWRDTIRWLATAGQLRPGEQISMNLSRSTVELGDPVGFEIALRSEAAAGFSPKLSVVDPEGQTTIVALTAAPGPIRRFRGEFTPRKVGLWQAELGADPLQPARQTRTFNAYDADAERLDSAAAPQLLRDLAESNGGMFLRGDQPVDLASMLHQQTIARTAPPRLMPIWDRAWVMAGLLALLCLEWIVRRLLGWM